MQLRSGRIISSNNVDLSIQTGLDFSQYDHPITPVMDSPSSHALLRPCVTPTIPSSLSDFDNIYYSPVYDSNPSTPRRPTLSPTIQTPPHEENEYKIMYFTSQIELCMYEIMNNINENNDKKTRIKYAILLFKIILQNRDLFHLPKMTTLKNILYPKYIELISESEEYLISIEPKHKYNTRFSKIENKKYWSTVYLVKEFREMKPYVKIVSNY